MSRHLVITVHGIRTFGQWQERLEAMLRAREPGITVLNYKYGYFSLLAFIIPLTRWFITRRFRRELARCAGNGWDRIDLVAHSFGTHLVSWALHGMIPSARPQVHTVILAGSVLKPAFPWADLLVTSVRRVVNECGVHDTVLLMNQLIVPFTGMAGRVGFAGLTGDDLRNRFYRFGHSGYFELAGKPEDAFMNERWLPLLLSEETTTTAPDPRSSSPIVGLGTFIANNMEPIKLSVVIGVLALPLLIYMGLYQQSQNRLTMATARGLVTQAQLLSARDAALRERAGLLAVESMRRLPTLEGNQSLQEVLRLLPRPLALFSHSGPVNSATLSPDGRTVATAGADGQVRLWDLAAPNDPTVLTHGTSVKRIVFLRHGAILVSLSDSVAISWDTRTHQTLARLPQSDWVNAMRTDPGDSLVAIGSEDGVARVWNPATGNLVAQFRHGAPVNALAFSRDGSQLAVGTGSTLRLGFPGAARIWTLSTHQSLPPFPHDDPVTAVTFGARDIVLVTGDQGGKVTMWNAQSRPSMSFESGGTWVRSLLRTGDGWLMGGHSGGVFVLKSSTGDLFQFQMGAAVTSVAFDSTNLQVAASSRDHTARVWSLTTGDDVARMIHQDVVNTVTFTPDGRSVLTSSNDGTVRLWNASAVAASEFAPAGALAISGDGSLIASGTNANRTGRLSFFETRSGRQVAMLDDVGVTDLAFSDSGGFFAAAFLRGFAGYVGLWKTTDSGVAEIHEWRTSGEPSALAFSPDGGILAAGEVPLGSQEQNPEPSLTMWNTADQTERPPLGEHEWVTNLLFSPGGDQLAVARINQGFRIWDLRPPPTSLVDVTLGKGVEAFAFSRDNHWFAWASRDSVGLFPVFAFDSALTFPPQKNVSHLAFSADGRLLAMNDSANGVRIWDFIRKTQMFQLQHDARVLGLSFSKSGRWLATGSADRTARIWDVQNGHEVSRIVHDGTVDRAFFTPDESRLISASTGEGGFARVSVWKTVDVIAESCQRFTRNLTKVEWETYVGSEPYRETCPIY